MDVGVAPDLSIPAGNEPQGHNVLKDMPKRPLGALRSAALQAYPVAYSVVFNFILYETPAAPGIPPLLPAPPLSEAACCTSPLCHSCRERLS